MALFVTLNSIAIRFPQASVAVHVGAVIVKLYIDEVVIVCGDVKLPDWRIVPDESSITALHSTDKFLLDENSISKLQLPPSSHESEFGSPAFVIKLPDPVDEPDNDTSVPPENPGDEVSNS